MAVYTVLSEAQFKQILDAYDIGSLRQARAVTEGIENTNYFVDVDSNHETHCYLLTIFEHMQECDLRFYLAWLEQLKQHSLPVASALADRTGQMVQQLQGKPAALFHKLRGAHPSRIELSHCQAVGSAVAQLHNAALKQPLEHQGPRSLAWLEQLAKDIALSLDKEDRALLSRAQQECSSLPLEQLPQAMIHGDLFPDNTLFEGQQLSGLLDFYSGGTGPMIFDLAVACNAWCAQPNGLLNPEYLKGMLAGYQELRSFTVLEQKHWYRALVLAALRFWLSRVADTLAPRAGHHPDAVYVSKNPDEYREILRAHLRQL